MLRASSQGLSFTLPTVTRAIIPWKVAYSTRNQVHSIWTEKAAPPSTGTPRQAEGGDVFPQRPLPVSQRKAGFVGSISHGEHGGALAAIPSNAIPTPTAARTTYAFRIGSKKTRDNEKGILARRIRPLHSVPPRWIHPRFGERRIRVSSMPAKDRTIGASGVSGTQDYPVFHGQVAFGPTNWKRGPTDRILQAIDATCARRNERSPSTAISRHLAQLARGKVLQDVWDSYLKLVQLQRTHPVVHEKFPPSRIPSKLLWRVCHCIIRSHPITSSHFPSLLKVVQHIWDEKRQQQPSLVIWNGLIKMAAKGQRKGEIQGFQRSLAIMNDYVKGKRPGSSLDGPAVDISRILDPMSPNQPDIYTINTLIHIASATLDAHTLQDTTFLLRQSGIAPNRITHLSLLNFYSKKGQLSGVRSVVRKLHDEGMELGIDGLNACLWAHSLSNQAHIALDIYRVLRNNVHPDPDPEAISRLTRWLEIHEHIHINSHEKPDHRTYVASIQAMAYHGLFPETFTIFADFLQTTPSGRLSPSTSPAFRAMFLGFCKYAVSRLEESVTPDHPNYRWNIDNLQRVYRLFLKMPRDVIPSRSTIYWILVAFDKTSDHDIYLLRELWLELEGRFAPVSPSLFNQTRLQRIKAILFPKGAEHG